MEKKVKANASGVVACGGAGLAAIKTVVYLLSCGRPSSVPRCEGWWFKKQGMAWRRWVQQLILVKAQVNSSVFVL